MLIKRVVDPFFATKPIGMGPGLGLSMVYGFVRQSGGQVRVCSELGKGTTMCLYLPRFIGQVGSEAHLPTADSDDAGKGQTVLVIDDEQTLCALVAEVLEARGYRALTAHDGQTGLQILQSPQRVDLLVTDVGLPGGLNGRQVADAARAIRPGLKVLFVTGYAENAVWGNGHLDPGMSVLTKPFEIAALASKVRALIDDPVNTWAHAALNVANAP